MKTYYDIPLTYDKPKHGRLYQSNHPLYRYCTLYERCGVGLSVVQMRFNEELKVFFWGPIDEYLVDAIYLNPRFDVYFISKCGKPKDRIFPTVKLRSLMWALRMKPLKKEPWEQELQRL